MGTTTVDTATRRWAEWPTWVVAAGCYAGWAAVTWFHTELGPWLFFPLTVPLVTLHSSLQHEVLHGHPTRSATWNEALVYPALGILVPYRRFRDTHLKHHDNEHLTDPYDDPESWYLAQRDYRALSRPLKFLLAVNATLAGRLLFGPALACYALWCGDWQRARSGDRGVQRAYLHHLFGVVLVLAWTWWLCGIHPLAYIFGVGYPAFSLLMVRTFAEHRAEEAVPERTAIIEAETPLALLFLNNNLHAAHHERPALAWYQLPHYYREHRARLLDDNNGYSYRGYAEIFRRFFLRQREPVEHPFMYRETDPE